MSPRSLIILKILEMFSSNCTTVTFCLFVCLFQVTK